MKRMFNETKIINEIFDFCKKHGYIPTNMNIDGYKYNIFVNSMICNKDVNDFAQRMLYKYYCILVNIIPDADSCFELKDKLKSEVVKLLDKYFVSIKSEIFGQGSWKINNKNIVYLDRNEYYVRINKLNKNRLDDKFYNELNSIGDKYLTNIEIQFI